MPSFNKKMIPALNIDYKKVEKLVTKKYNELKKASSIEVTFKVDKKDYKLIYSPFVF